MDLSMIPNNGESLQIIISTEFSVHASVMGFRVYRNIWPLKIAAILETRIEPENKEDKYALPVIDKECCLIGHLPKGKRGKYTKAFLLSFPFYVLMS